MPIVPLTFDAKRQFPSIGECIYCGAKDKLLTKEHIIPYAIAGNAVTFAKSSCLDCADFFKREFEAYVLERNFAPLRFKVHAPSRRKKHKPDRRSLQFVRLRGQDKHPIITFDRVLSREEYPVGFLGLRLIPPRILCGIELVRQPDVEPFTLVDRRALKVASKASLHKDACLGEINPEKFAKFLAKIAYSFAIAEKGTGAFEPLILPFLFGKTNIFSDLVGGDYDIPTPTPDEVHRLQNSIYDANVAKFHFVTIRLFGNLGTPVYHVVVGRS